MESICTGYAHLLKYNTKLTNQGNMKGKSPTKKDDCGLRVPVIINVGHPEGYHFRCEAMEDASQPVILPATSHNECCPKKWRD